jgi:hypothetical protein
MCVRQCVDCCGDGGITAGPVVAASGEQQHNLPAGTCSSSAAREAAQLVGTRKAGCYCNCSRRCSQILTPRSSIRVDLSEIAVPLLRVSESGPCCSCSSPPCLSGAPLLRLWRAGGEHLDMISLPRTIRNQLERLSAIPGIRMLPVADRNDRERLRLP